MMEFLRRGATSKIAAIVLFLPLIAAFALWGIGPEIRNGIGQPWLAQVGDVRITPEEFDRSFRTQLEQISRQVGRPITPEMARTYGLDRQVLLQLSGRAALDQEVRRLGLTEATPTVVEAVRADPAFGDGLGKFSKAHFDQIVRQAGMSEANYLAARKRDDVRDELTNAIVAGVAPPTAIIDLMNSYRGETRVISFVTIDPAVAVKIAAPDDAKLKTFYDANTRLFVTGEQRKIGVLSMTRDAIKAKIKVDDADVKAAYDATKDRYDVAETRRIYQVPFADKAAAEKAQPGLATAKDFVAEAVKLGVKAADIDLGTLSKAQMIDPKIADAAFALKADQVSKVVDGTFSTVVLKVGAVNPAQVKTLADVAEQVKDTLQTQRSAAEMQTLSAQVEDERSAGRPLPEIAQKLGLTYTEIASVDAAGKAPDGKPALASPDLAQIAAAAFTGALGFDPDPVDLADGGVTWVSVLAIAPAKERPFDEVKADVATAWTEEETRRELGVVAAHLVEQLIKGDSLEVVAKAAGGKPTTTGAITRTTSPPGLTSGAVQQAFALPQGGASSALTADGKSRTVFKVDLITPAPAPTKVQADRIKDQLTREMQADVINTYVDGLQKQLGVKINDAALARSFSGNGPRQ